MHIRHLVLTSILSIFAFSTNVVAASADPVVKKSNEISTFGIKLGQPITELNVLKVQNMGERYSVEPSQPIEFFDSYNITTTPDYKVYKVFASGEIKNARYSCNEAAAFLSNEFEKTYDTSLFKPVTPKVGQYIYMSKDVSVSIMCIGQNLGYTFAYQKDLSSYPVPIEKFKDFNIKI